MRATSLRRTWAPLGSERTTTSPNSSAVSSRPWARTFQVSSWPGGAGSPPIFPDGFTAFCFCTASTRSGTVSPRRASTSGFTQMRIA